MTDREWHFSGFDMRNHAFRTYRGWPVSAYQVVPDFGRVECRVTSCHQFHPVAYVLSHNACFEYRRCLRCLSIAGAAPPRPSARTAVNIG